MSEQVQTHYHGEVKVQRNGVEIRVNIFKDNREELYYEIQHAIAQFSGDPKYMNQAQLEIARAQQAAAAAGKPFKEQKLPAPSPKATGIVNTPICRDCGTDEAVELITFTDRDTGQLKRRFKCQACGKWLGKAF